jgi:hypothetical protein
MILIKKNEIKSIAFYLTPTKTAPEYCISIENKTSKVFTFFNLINISNTDVFQEFDFQTISNDLEYGSYNYKMYENDSIGNPTTTSNILEVGLLNILGIGNCIEPDITYADTSNDVIYYDCDNT